MNNQKLNNILWRNEILFFAAEAYHFMQLFLNIKFLLVGIKQVVQ